MILFPPIYSSVMGMKKNGFFLIRQYKKKWKLFCTNLCIMLCYHPGSMFLQIIDPVIQNIAELRRPLYLILNRTIRNRQQHALGIFENNFCVFSSFIYMFDMRMSNP